MEDAYLFPSRDDDEQQELPPGFRFHPTDEELVTYYLSRKAADCSFSTSAIGEVDLIKCEPWDLPWKGAMMGEKEWYFFCVRDRKYPAGMRTNRATDAGYWKATGKDKEIRRGRNLVGRKKTLVFYRGRAPKGDKTGWVMHEYRLDGDLSLCNKAVDKNEWVICRVFEKSSSCAAATTAEGGGEKKMIGLQARMGSSSSYGDAFFDPPQPLTEFPSRGTDGKMAGTTLAASAAPHVTCFSNAPTSHRSHEGSMDLHSSFPVFSDSLSLLPLAKLSGEAGLLQLPQSHGHVVKERINKAEREVERRSGPVKQEISSPLLLSNHEVRRVQKFPYAPSGNVPFGDCIWNN